MAGRVMRWKLKWPVEERGDTVDSSGKRPKRSTSQVDYLSLPHVPPIAGLRLRHFRGERDFMPMSAVAERCKKADESEDAINVEAIAHRFRNSTNCDPYRDRLFVEIDYRLIGYSRVWWAQEAPGSFRYLHASTLDPDWRTTALEYMMLRYCEDRLRQVAAQHPPDATRVFETGTISSQITRADLLRREGYLAVRYFYDMVRTLADPTPAPVLPEGLEVRTAKAAHYRPIWDAWQECLRDHWGFVPQDEDDYQRWLHGPTFSPSIWQVAWSGDEVAALILNYVDQAENAEFHRLRGYTENIMVRRAWRRRGLARALLLRSLRLLKDVGMEQAMLTVDAENPSGAMRLYESVGFTLLKEYIAFRKPMS